MRDAKGKCCNRVKLGEVGWELS